MGANLMDSPAKLDELNEETSQKSIFLHGESLFVFLLVARTSHRSFTRGLGAIGNIDWRLLTISPPSFLS